MNVPDPDQCDRGQCDRGVLDCAARTAAMAQHRRRIAQSRSTDEHLQIVERLQREAMRAIRGDAIAYQAFMARNHRKRRREAVERLQSQLLARRGSETHE